MQLKNAPNDVQSMSQDGDAILRSLQNKSLPVIDLMVRESLQNSLDAGLKDKAETIVDFKTGTFSNIELAQHFEGITDTLEEKYTNNPEFLAVMDKNTTGLTGDYKSNDGNILNKSNFHKLVFGIGKNQEADGAGGSWGLGKTSYFRLGVGLVIYYTRVKLPNQEYEERLIASLIESPKQSSRLLPENGRGIAWWGEYAEDDTSNRILPITDKENIEDILNIFDIPRYKENETGTSIIIPYVGSNELYATEIEEDDLMPWQYDYDSEIRMAVQRWYSPRLMNMQYSEFFDRPKLNCKVNSYGFVRDINTELTFDIIQDLYNSALTASPAKPNIIVEPIHLARNAMSNPSKTPVGHIAFKEFSREELNMTPPNNKYSPLAYIGLKEEDKINNNTSKIIAYSRMPGMVVEYSIDGEWAPKSLIQKEDHLLIGFFVPNSNGALIERYQKDGYNTLEQYLRATENADHANWIDEDGVGIIRRMKEYTSKAINNFYQGDMNEKQSSATSGLSRKFGKFLMPPKDFGKTSGKKPNDPTKPKRNVAKRNRVSDISVLQSNPIDSHNVEVTFEASIKKESDNKIFLQVLSQEKKMDSKEWFKSFSDVVPFPFEIDNLFIETINDKKIHSDYQSLNDDSISIYQDPNVKYEINISSKVSDGAEIRGKLKLHANNNQFIPNVAISSEVNKGGETE